MGGPIIKDKLWFYGGFDVSTETYDVNRSFWHEIYSPNTNGWAGWGQLDPTTGNPVTAHINGMDQHYIATAPDHPGHRQPDLRSQRQQQDLGLLHRGSDADRRPR